jgi:2-polyprenyl-3-methyl-5-hydroxy-6-metoxy-1,4-benzoquinol methylase
MCIYKLNKAKYGTHNIISEEIGGNKVVLDIGCNKGYLYGLAPNNIFYGIDSNEEELEVAKANYEKVYKIDLNYNYKEFKEDIKFDVMIFADILEHLIYPEIVLKYFVSNFLKNNGKVIISLPNIAHLSIRLKLLFGRFDYTDSGILDKTHLHLYTVKTAQDFVHNTGYLIEKIKYSSDNFGYFLNKFKLFTSFLAYTVIIVARCP